MTWLDFKGIDVGGIKFRLDSLIGRIFHKEEHNEKILNVDARQAIGTQIGQQQIAIEKQIVLQLPEGLPQSDQANLVRAVLRGDGTPVTEIPISPEASGDAQLPEQTTSSPTEDFLKRRHSEYLTDTDLLLDRGGLLNVYKERESISFSKDELVFLTQSSFKNDFPVWFWLFNYRERFGNVVPLLQNAITHSSVKIRCGVISSLNDFTDTTDEIVSLMETERNPEVLGYAVSRFIEKNDTERAQRTVANALTRKIIPVLTSKAQKKSRDIVLELGAAEKRVLHNEIENGWQNDKLKALTILSLSADERDLPLLEKWLTSVTYTDVVNLILACIKRVGKTTKAEHIEKELEDTRWEETFVSHLEALAAVKYKTIFPKLLEWLSDRSSITNRFWTDTSHRKIDAALQEAIQALLDKDTYELLVQYILRRYSPDRYPILSWRHFWVLRKLKNNPEVTALLKQETRLSVFEEQWRDVVADFELEEKTSQTDAKKLLVSVTPEKSQQSMLVLRKYYELTSSEQAIVAVAPLIGKFRENLVSRLSAIASGEHPVDVKELAKNDLEKFLGENRMFFRLHRKRKNNSRYETEETEDADFEKLSNDIENFSAIEKEYYAHVLQAKSTEANAVLINSIGRPYDSIYESITKESGNLERLNIALQKLIDESPNTLTRLKAADALLRIGKGDRETIRAAVIGFLITARDNTKASRGMVKGSDDWFVSEITYLWAVDVLIEIGNPRDFQYVREAANREKILARHFSRYADFHGYEVIEELLALSETLENAEERENALSALSTLDYNWTKKVLGIES
jgi:hypothetical protein